MELEGKGMSEEALKRFRKEWESNFSKVQKEQKLILRTEKSIVWNVGATKKEVLDSG